MKVYFLLFLIFVPFFGKSQQTDPFFSKHIISIEAGGISPYYINYENIVNPNDFFKLAIGVSGSYYKIDSEKKFQLYKAHAGVLAGEAPFYAAAGLHAIKEVYWERYIHFTGYDYGVERNIDYDLALKLSFLYLPEKSGLYAGVSVYYTGDDHPLNLESYLGYDLYFKNTRNVFSPSVSIGYTFNTGKRKL